MLKPAFVLLATLWAGLSIGRPIDAQIDVEFNTAMMDATIQIGGPSITQERRRVAAASSLAGHPSKRPNHHNTHLSQQRMCSRESAEIMLDSLFD